MTDSRTPPKQDDPARQAATYNINRWIEVRGHQIPPVNNEGGRQPNPHQTQHTIDAGEIVGWVRRHGREEPWDGVGMVPASQTTTVNWYHPQQPNNQHGNYDGQYQAYSQGNAAYQQGQGNDASGHQPDRGNDVYHHGFDPQSVSSTQVEYGSRQSDQGHISSGSRRERRHRGSRSQRHA